MATATELTLALGRTLYGGDPEDDERIQCREVRVSVTWALTEDEQDLPLAVSALAEEAQRALDQADRVAHRAATASLTTNVGTTARPEPNGASGNGHVFPAPGAGQGQAFGNGQRQPPMNGQNGGPGVTAPRYGGYVPPARKDGNEKDGNEKDGKQPGKAAPAAPTPTAVRPDPITAPQRLAIRSLCTRMELAEPELSRLLDGRFGKRRLEELSKADAGALLEALQRGAWEDEAETPAYAH